MAKYTEGYKRGLSDKSKFIILISFIIAAVALVIAFIALYNNFWKKPAKSLTSEAYQSYFLTDYTKLLDQEKRTNGNYMIYVCSTEEVDDHNLNTVLSYLDAQIEGKTTLKLYLLDYSKFDSTSDSTETANNTAVETELGFSVNLGYLIYVQDNEISNKSTQVKTKTHDVKDALNSIKKSGTWE